MNKESFEQKFKKIVVDPLIEIGFKHTGETLYFVEGDIAISLIRFGGRMSLPGGISHILCFRHSFLPNVEEKIPVGYEENVFSYPIKLKPSCIKSQFGAEIKYYPSNLNYDYEHYSFQDKSEQEVVVYLKTVFNSVLLLLDWSKKRPFSYLQKQIKKNGESAWVESLWLNAYSEHTI
jgi:hypothetical protein